MAEIDINKLEYKIIAITQTGGAIPLNNFIQSCTWQDQNKELAQRNGYRL